MGIEQKLKTDKFRNEKHKALVSILVTAYQLKSLLSQTLKKYDLTAEQYNVLRIIRGSSPNPLCVKDIAGRIIERNSNVPRIADRLVAKKLISRQPSPDDRRETHLELTSLGYEKLELAGAELVGLEESWIPISESDAHHLNKLLDQIM